MKDSRFQSSIPVWGGPARSPLADMALVFATALALRALFALAAANTYDFDEFVLLQLARDFAHGAVPYSQFKFFHPPGALLLLRVVQPLTDLWWPAARVLMFVLDSITAGLVCLIGQRIYDRRSGLIAGLLYAFSPLSLVSAVRVGQDPLLTFFLVAGLGLVVSRTSNLSAVVAGICFAAAVWMKYPALAFLPAFCLLARRRAPLLVLGACAAFVLLLLPFHDQLNLLYQQTVDFQRSRWKMMLDVRLLTALIWWLGVNLVAVLALTSRRPLWLKVGFLTGAVFLLSSQVYYHYFVPVAPFAALLGAPSVARLSRIPLRAFAALGVGLTAFWAGLLNLGGPSPLYVTAAHLSDVQPAVRILERATRPQDPVLADQLEYQYLARRPALDDYFWNVGVLVNAHYLEQKVRKARAVVMSHGASSGFPAGFARWLNRRYRRLDTRSSVVWLPPATAEKPLQ
jgi:Dolichyl-phosphate-mannose-protein mannosyltransferase